MHGLITYTKNASKCVCAHLHKHCSLIASIICRNQCVAWLILHFIMHKINQSYWFLIVQKGGCAKSCIFKHKTWHVCQAMPTSDFLLQNYMQIMEQSDLVMREQMWLPASKQASKHFNKCRYPTVWSCCKCSAGR